MTLKELLSEQGVAYRKGVLLDTQDANYIGICGGNWSHGKLLRVLEEFYDKYHAEIYDYQINLFEQFLEEKANESNGLN